jgi:ABC-type transport system involved in multi-copper enzyme maturation permease subunit
MPMSTATFDTPATAAETGYGDSRQTTMVRRFVWKEARMVRGLWLALVGMGAIVQWVVNAFAPPAMDQALLLFSIALGATVLYAVGAAATSFSVEHEDETYDFLAGLPARWWPLYIGKLAVVIVSCVAMAKSLSIIGWVLCGFDTPGAQDTRTALGLLGVAVLEGIAWGTLFSLLVKRPLVAAMLTLVVGAVAVNVIVTWSSSYAVASLNPAAYLEVLPMRLAVVAIVMLASCVIARGWLVAGRTASGSFSTSGRWKSIWPWLAARFWPASISENRGSRAAMLSRLVWQTWRDGRTLLLVPLGVGLLLLLGVTAVIEMLTVASEPTAAALVCSVFLVPALYGALAFSADQRRERYRYLSEHAGRPRYVWLARHIVWLGTLVVIALAFFLVMFALVLVMFRAANARFTEGFVRWGQHPPEIDFGFIVATSFAIQGTLLAALGIPTAYSLGQLCSILMRSEILAAFLALVLSVLLSAWIALLFVWQLSGWLFLAPLAAGLMLATWLRTPDWIAGRNNWRSWAKPVLAVGAAVSLVAVALPAARLLQVRKYPVSIAQFSPLDGPPSRETAVMYREAVELLNTRPSNIPLDRWMKREFMDDDRFISRVRIDETKIPPDQLADFRAARATYQKQVGEAQAAAIKLASEASARQFCYFDFDVAQITSLFSVESYRELNELLALLSSIEPVEPFDRLLAALRMSAHLSAGQPSVVWLDQAKREQLILRKVGEWTAYEGRTREELESALAQLTEHFRVGRLLQETLYADHRLVKDAILARQPSLVLTREPDSLANQLAFMANELPWERERALAALETITRQNAADAQELSHVVGNSSNRELGNTTLRRWLRPRGIHRETWPETWLVACPAAATSYLTRFEYAARSPVHELYRAFCDGETCRRAAQLQIALAMFRLDHGEYPALLAELVPDYMESLPLDPYLGQPFQYEPHGLDRPLVPWSNYSPFEEIAPFTPLVWSVGPGNARLKVHDRRLVRPGRDDAEGAAIEISELVYIIAVEEDGWWGEPALVFPLAD